MNKKNTLLVMLLLFTGLKVLAQDNSFYYYKSKKIMLEIDSTKLDVFNDTNFSITNINTNNFGSMPAKHV